MSLCDRLSMFVLNLRRQLVADSAARQAGDPQADALDTILKYSAWWAGGVGANLNLLAALCGTDKYGAHNYTPIYRELMSKSRRKPIRLLELGVGGYQGGLGGESLLMWAAYFRRGLLYAVDIYDKTALSRGRIKVMQCSQTDRARMTEISASCGPFDFIIDDGSHLNSDQIESFRILWPFVKDRGLYIIEDVQTSYWPSYGGGQIDSRDYASSCISYFKGLVDSVNLPEFLTPVGPGSPLDPSIGNITFHHNLIVVTKDTSVRSSNAPLADKNLRKMLLSRQTV